MLRFNHRVSPTGQVAGGLGTPVNAMSLEDGVRHRLGFDFGKPAMLHAAPVQLSHLVVGSMQQDMAELMSQHGDALLRSQPAPYLNLVLCKIGKTVRQAELRIGDLDREAVRACNAAQ